MTIEFSEEPMTALPEYARIPIAFTVDRTPACGKGSS
jgi:hypothetical protein